MRAASVTLRHVALAAGVSPKTVSRVVNRDGAVAEVTRDRVQAVVDRLSYVPDPLARSLRCGQDQAIGLVVESVEDPFFASIVGAVEKAADIAGRSVYVVSTYRDAVRERSVIEGLAQRRVAGLIVAPSGTDLGWLSALGVPTVFIDRPGVGMPADVVRVDDLLGSRLATEHLLAHGHRRIGLIGGPAALPTARERRAGYRAALTAAGVPSDPALEIFEVLSGSDAQAAAERLLTADRPATALLVAAARGLDGVVVALHRLGRCDVALVGFGDIPLAAVVEPAITVLDHSPALMGSTAVRRLLAALDDGALVPETVTLPIRLVVRGSGELRP